MVTSFEKRQWALKFAIESFPDKLEPITWAERLKETGSPLLHVFNQGKDLYAVKCKNCGKVWRKKVYNARMHVLLPKFKCKKHATDGITELPA